MPEQKARVSAGSKSRAASPRSKSAHANKIAAYIEKHPGTLPEEAVRIFELKAELNRLAQKRWYRMNRETAIARINVYRPSWKKGLLRSS